MKKFLKYGLIFFLALGFIGAMSGASNVTEEQASGSQKVESSAEQKPTKTKKQTVKVSLASFIKEFDSNQLAAEQKYENKIIETTGYVHNISEGLLGEYYMILVPSSDKYYIGTELQCYFDNKKELLSIKNGQKVTVQGEFKSQDLGNIILEHCHIKK